MRSPLKPTAALLPLVLVVACNKGPAQEAIKSADAAVQAAQADAAKFVPDKFKELEATAKAARDKFDKGDYAGALADAKGIVAKAQEVAAAGAAKREEVTRSWDTISSSLPPALDQLKARLQLLAASRSLPKGLDGEKLAEAQKGFESVSQIWSDAMAAAQGGKLLEAVNKASEIQGRVGELLNSVGVDAPPSAISPKREY